MNIIFAIILIVSQVPPYSPAEAAWEGQSARVTWTGAPCVEIRRPGSGLSLVLCDEDGSVLLPDDVAPPRDTMVHPQVGDFFCTMGRDDACSTPLGPRPPKFNLWFSSIFGP